MSRLGHEKVADGGTVGAVEIGALSFGDRNSHLCQVCWLVVMKNLY